MKPLTTSEFIERAQKVHGNHYDYSKVVYINQNTKVCIICPIHGEFWQMPSNHLVGKGCLKCRGNKIWESRGRVTTSEYIEKAQNLCYNMCTHVDKQSLLNEVL